MHVGQQAGRAHAGPGEGEAAARRPAGGSPRHSGSTWPGRWALRAGRVSRARDRWQARHRGLPILLKVVQASREVLQAVDLPVALAAVKLKGLVSEDAVQLGAEWVGAGGARGASSGGAGPGLGGVPAGGPCAGAEALAPPLGPRRSLCGGQSLPGQALRTRASLAASPRSKRRDTRVLRPKPVRVRAGHAASALLPALWPRQ